MKKNQKAQTYEEVREILTMYAPRIDEICEAIEETGSLLGAAEKLNIKYSILKILERFNKKVSNACFYATCMTLDKVERELVKEALEGDLNAIKFYLETVGRGRFHKAEEKVMNIKGNVGEALSDFLDK